MERHSSPEPGLAWLSAALWWASRDVVVAVRPAQGRSFCDVQPRLKALRMVKLDVQGFERSSKSNVAPPR